MSSRKRKQMPTSSSDHCTSFEDLLQRVDECLRRQSATVSALLLPGFEGVDVLAAVVCKFVFSNPFTHPIPCWIPHFEEVETLEASAEQLEGTRMEGMPLCGDLLLLECQISGSDLPHEWLRFHPFEDLRVEMVMEPLEVEVSSSVSKLHSNSAPTRAEIKRLRDSFSKYYDEPFYTDIYENTEVLERWEKQWDLPRCVGALNLHLGLPFESTALAIGDDNDIYMNSAYEKLDVARNAAALHCNKGKTFVGEIQEQLGGFIRGKRDSHLVDCEDCGCEVRAELLFIRVNRRYAYHFFPYNLLFCPSHPTRTFCPPAFDL